MGNGLFWDLNHATARTRPNRCSTAANIARIARAAGAGIVHRARATGLVRRPGTTPEMLSYIQYVGVDRSANNLEMISANISGDLFDMPAGALAFAAGYEHREQDGFFQPDARDRVGREQWRALVADQWQVRCHEYYAELAIPVLSDGLCKATDFGRQAVTPDYSTFGGESTGKLGMRWQVNDDFTSSVAKLCRRFPGAVHRRVVRLASRFDAVLNDPCSGYGSNSGVPANIVANCQALGVPANYQQPNPQISVVTGGNDELEPETADSINAGLRLQPSLGREHRLVTAL